jgi:hypothetical protein
MREPSHPTWVFFFRIVEARILLGKLPSLDVVNEIKRWQMADRPTAVGS